MFNILVSALYAMPIGLFSAACLRFDYHQASLTSSDPVVLQQVAAPTTGCLRRLSPGLIVPSRKVIDKILPRSQRIYYNICISIAAVSYLLLAPALHYITTIYVDSLPAKLSISRALEDQLFSILSMFLTVPLLAVGVGILAKMRGEAKALWTYQETWIKSPATGVEAQNPDAAPTLAEKEEGWVACEAAMEDAVKLDEAVKA